MMAEMKVNWVLVMILRGNRDREEKRGGIKGFEKD